MPLFKIDKSLKYINENPFRLEKEIQELTEKNLNTLLSLQFVKSEFALNKFRIDTLAFDIETNAFVIIEYKRDKNYSVIDQGYAYLSLMLNNKADFILEFNENRNDTLKRSDVDWSQSRVIFISPSFTNYQREAINFKDLPIELWQIKRFTNDSILFEQIIKAKSTESIKTITKNSPVDDNVNKIIKVYTEEEHLTKVNIEVKELYYKLKSAILNLDDLDVKPKKHYIAYVGAKNAVDIQPQKTKLKVWLNVKKGKLVDPKKLMRDVSTIGHLGNGDFEVQIDSDEDLEYFMSLVKQSIKQNRTR